LTLLFFYYCPQNQQFLRRIGGRNSCYGADIESVKRFFTAKTDSETEGNVDSTPKFDTDKRRYIRYELLDYAQLEQIGSGPTLNTIIVDIGLGGLQLRSREPVTVGTKCHITVGRMEGAILTFRAEIRHCAQVEGAELFGLGVRFLPESHDERMGIAEFVHAIFQRQCDLLAN